ncbi:MULTISPECIES: hypothetical protein [Kitasatospora]|uniref:Uncharacterized protein n=1 Tax=Kitasatospora setae (strain ATCC 33774 / DSM 43861 / JCM 3304 / KCC A-0304 / NBRC 14216 / KM-6054) TaxID=452652 RepID=E4N6D8_KITSK|nr:MULTISPECIES: hypothetical protein [Kitasatospora]BAJ26769.1 hypothetical protein KSE_09320 [Kitasatospora setae KM-6054]
MAVRSALSARRPLRLVPLVLALLAALLAVAVPAAAPAHAAVPDRWGFAYLDNPTPPPGYVPDPSRQWGSWPTPASNPVKVDQVSAGGYVVHFPLIGGPGGIAHATAVNRTGTWCQIQGWGTVGTGLDVKVACYDPSGAPAPSAFTVLFTSSSGTPTTPGNYGYLYSLPSGALVTQYNSAGGANLSSHGSTGIWKAWLPNLGSSVEVGNVQVTAVDSSQGARCKIANWYPASTGQTFLVACFDAANAPYDTAWTLSYSVKRAVHGPALPPKSFGYLWYNGSVPAGTNFNSVGGVNSWSIGVPSSVVLPGVAVPSDHAQVTAYGSGPGWCHLAQPWLRSGSTVQLTPLCFNPGGAPVAAPFLLAYTSAF